MSNDSNSGSPYAPAAGPVSKGAIHTDAGGLTTVRTACRSRGFDVPLYAGWPKGEPEKPVVLVLSEAFGLHEHIADIVRRFARAGYFAVAPDLMARQGDPMAFDDIGALVRELLTKIPDDQVMDDLDGCVEWATSHGGQTGRLAVTGFCWGGRWTWLYAAHRRFDAAVVWYGIVDGKGSGLFPDDPTLFPQHPLDATGEMKAPVLGLYGGQDTAIPLSSVELMRERLAQGSEAARRSAIKLYPEAGHAFFADYRDSYVKAAAEDGWRRCLEWIEQGMV